MIDIEVYPGLVYNLSQSVTADDDIILELAAANALAIIDSTSGMYIEIISVDFEGPTLQNNNTLEIRSCSTRPPVVITKDWQAAQSGTWWSPWYPVSCCHFCDKGPTSCSAGLGYSYTYGWSLTGGVTLAALSASTSFTLATSETWDSTFSCTWKGGDGPAQMWYQQQIYWADMQSRDRVVGSNCYYTNKLEPIPQVQRTHKRIKTYWL